MVDKDKTLYHKRAFLNPREGTAFIEATVRHEEWNGPKGKKYSSTAATLKIADCDRVVSLEFDADNKRQFKQRLRKADLLISTIQSLRAALVEEMERCNE